MVLLSLYDIDVRLGFIVHSLLAGMHSKRLVVASLTAVPHRDILGRVPGGKGSSHREPLLYKRSRNQVHGPFPFVCTNLETSQCPSMVSHSGTIPRKLSLSKLPSVRSRLRPL